MKNKIVNYLTMASLSSVIAMSSVNANSASPQSFKKESFSALADEFIDFKCRNNPDWATVLGIHKYDDQAPDLTREGIEKEISELKNFEKSFAAIDSKDLSAQEKIDLQLIDAQVKSDLLELADIRAWENNPDTYSSQASSMVYDLISRDFAPLNERIKLVIAREKKINAMLDAGKKNLKNPPKIYTEVALEQMPGIIDLFRNSIAEKLKGVSDEKLQAEFQTSNKAVIAQLEDYQKFLKEQVLPQSKGNFAIGEQNYIKKLRYDEMEERSIDELLSVGEKEMKRLQNEFIATAKEIDPSKSPTEVFTAISSVHAKPDELMPDITKMLTQLVDFCTKNKIVSIPDSGKLKVEETPAFMRALTFAAMDQPGPFEEKATEAYYYVTLPESGWSAERVEEHMRAFCKYDVINTSVHEAYPGHYVQGLWTRKAPSKVSKIFGANSNIEGWAHYCEQMMLEQGLENGDKKLKMVMLHDALLRCARYIVGIRMHTRGMSMDEGIDYFVKEGYQEKANAERETKRGTSDPTYLVYTLGKLQILALRDDYKKLKGRDFSLQDFHDKIMATGTPPIKIIRQILMGENK